MARNNSGVTVVFRCSAVAQVGTGAAWILIRQETYRRGMMNVLLYMRSLTNDRPIVIGCFISRCGSDAETRSVECIPLLTAELSGHGDLVCGPVPASRMKTLCDLNRSGNLFMPFRYRNLSLQKIYLKFVRTHTHTHTNKQTVA